MKQRYRLFKRGWGVYYACDNQTGQQESLATRNKGEAQRLLHARNEAHTQPLINRQIARAYLLATDPAACSRTWQWVMDEMGRCKQGVTRERWVRCVAEKPFERIRHLAVFETRPEDLLGVLASGTVSTNIFLRRLHNFALDMQWLLAPIIPRRQWPQIHFRVRRAITLEEHQKILAAERSPEWQAFYQLLWHLGGSQSDIATLGAEDIDWSDRTISYARRKTGTRAQIHFGESVAEVLRTRPTAGCLFPQLATWKESDRAKGFIRRCRLAGVSGVCLHSYRYAWAERARSVGYPERFAQEALGHKSLAVHRAYARKAQVKVPSLEQYEAVHASTKVISLPLPGATPMTPTPSQEPISQSGGN